MGFNTLYIKLCSSNLIEIELLSNIAAKIEIVLIYNYVNESIPTRCIGMTRQTESARLVVRIP